MPDYTRAPSMSRSALVLLAALALRAQAEGPPLREHGFVLEATADVAATLTASCAGCDWGTRGHEAAALELKVDGRYSQHLFLTQGAHAAEYRVALGRLDRGRHQLTVLFDAGSSGSDVRAAEVKAVAIAPAVAGSLDGAALAHSPILHARPDTLGRFSDVPLVMWYEREPTARGIRTRYSVVFSNEDGGTPSDRLMATWGRLTDIEYVYGVELDPQGRVLSEQFQSRDHKLVPFSGRHEAAHPLLYVVTDNNMLDDHGEATLRVALVPIPFDLTNTSREAVMDAHPWTYRVSVAEARREGRVDEAARPGDHKLPDPRRFVTLEACAPAEDATIAFSVGVHGPRGELRWFDSDGGRKEFRIARRPHEFPTGCFRGAVALAAGVAAADVAGLRFRAFTRVAEKEEPPLPKGSGRAQLQSVNTLFLLGPDDLPGPRLFSWRGDVALVPDGPPFEIAIKASRTER